MDACSRSLMIGKSWGVTCVPDFTYLLIPSIHFSKICHWIQEFSFLPFASQKVLLNWGCSEPFLWLQVSLSCCFPLNLNLSEESQLASVDTSHHACLEESPPVRWSSVIQRCGFVSIHSRALSTSRIISSRLLNSRAFCTRSRFLASFTALPDRLNCADF